MNILTLDCETSIYSKGNAFDKRNICVTIHTKLNDEKTVCKFYDQPDFLAEYKLHIAKAKILVGHNLKFDVHWLSNLHQRLPDGLRVWDTMVAEFILSGQTSGFTSLNDLCAKYGLGQKHDEVADYWAKGISTEDIPRDIVETYGNWDVDLAYKVYLEQLKDPRMNEAIRKLILLAGADLLVLQEMEYNGLKYNKEKSVQKAKECNERIREIETSLLEYGRVEELNFNSDDQLSAYLYGGSYTKDVFHPVTAIVKSGPNKGQEKITNRFLRTDEFKFPGFFTPLKGTALKKEGLYSTSGDVLKQLNAKTKLQKVIVSLLLERADLAKISGTYYEGLPKLMEEMNWDGFIHGQFNQVVARTGRLSSSKPNLQNNPPDADELFESRYG